MPTENNSTTGSTVETTGQEQQEQQSASGSETQSTEQGQQSSTDNVVTIDDSTRLPDTHPLVKAYLAQREENKKTSGLKTELAEANARAAKAAQLEEELNKRPTQEALDTLQTRYDRLEGFLQAVGGPLSKALDSRSFTRDLFESDKDIQELVREWNTANPSATSAALSSGGGQTNDGKPNMNDILRSAAKG